MTPQPPPSRRPRSARINKPMAVVAISTTIVFLAIACAVIGVFISRYREGMSSTPTEAADKLMSAIESDDSNAATAAICDASSIDYAGAKRQVLGVAEASGG